MFDYQAIFDQRGELYNRATRACPEARAIERALLLDRLALDDGLVVCDAPAGGGYVADGILHRCAALIICVEPSRLFAATIDPRVTTIISPLHAIDLESATVDRVASLAGLHHLASKEAFFLEAARILRPGGRVAVGDVMDGTPPAAFLNGPVDELSATGHDGMFVSPGELSLLLTQAGFVDVSEEHCKYTWRFPNIPAMVEFCADLFGLVGAGPERILHELERGPGVFTSNGSVELCWSLAYASGALPTAI